MCVPIAEFAAMASGVLQFEAGLQCGLVGCSRGLPMQNLRLVIDAQRQLAHEMSSSRSFCTRTRVRRAQWHGLSPKCMRRLSFCTKKTILNVPGHSAQPEETWSVGKKNDFTTPCRLIEERPLRLAASAGYLGPRSPP